MNRLRSTSPVAVTLCMAVAACGSAPSPYWLGPDADAGVDAPGGAGDAGGDGADVGGPDDTRAPDARDSDIDRTDADAATDTDTSLDGEDSDSGSGTVEAVVDLWVAYEDRIYGAEGFTGALAERPARSVVVSVVRLSDGSVVAETLTDDAGSARLAFFAASGERHTVRVHAVAKSEGFRVEVRDRSSEAQVYSFGSEVFELGSDGAYRAALVARADDPMGGALNIVDRTLDGFRFVARFSDYRAPTLLYSWQPGRSFSCGSCYVSPYIDLGGHPDDPDEYDDDIILHEFAHYVVHHYGDDDSWGGAHRDRLVDPWLAYAEGLAYFVSSAVRDDPTMVDNFADDVRFIDYEAVTIGGRDLDDFYGTSDGTMGGNLREEIVAGLMWDVYDGPSAAEPWDQVSLGDAASAILFDYFRDGLPVDVGLRGIEITDYLNAAACVLGDPAPIQALVDERKLPWDVADAMRCDFDAKDDAASSAP